MALTALQQLQLNLNEAEYPYFTDEQLNSYLEMYGNNVLLASWRLCLVKASTDDEIKVGSIEVSSSNSDYWNNLAAMYKTDYEAQQAIVTGGTSGYRTSMRRSDRQ
ncbi:hypothetical protein [Clostridium beijerinckii]|jgi:hypothetical protein|uniref:hypothetical protein n=1 Tax=Clostridium beijerinckii TaxID=1520 RepID=UPI001361DEC4|nr:hypothetical protein [Clostridium beijerinckii]MZK53672.1 hypothetical protein [Clostridium beijerinckii]MZK61801.1 hypothetical protein [Clostridium beijerinckii]MZK71982.1 hypothetical protein [Clostridium beijerinckii]MZK77375.1 hypothetical protein [Clostridium beijerinckii]MZK86953.1 hypothetical protein [Clostridium beijerinckii]